MPGTTLRTFGPTSRWPQVATRTAPVACQRLDGEHHLGGRGQSVAAQVHRRGAGVVGRPDDLDVDAPGAR